jgi:glutamate decarboxylase
MVHLDRVQNDKDLADKATSGLEDLSFKNIPGEDEFTSSVYGSRFAAADLPKNEMPEEEMPREIAYRMIKYNLSRVLNLDTHTDTLAETT